MSDFSRFRSAFNGFSRTDVVNYIEETSAAHQKAIEQLEGEKQQLMQENDAPKEQYERMNLTEKM